MALSSKSPLFHSTSRDKPSILHVSFESDPNGSLGCQLVNLDKVSCRLLLLRSESD